MKFRKTIATVLVLVAGLIGSVVIVSPAQADDPYWYQNCDGYSICFYEELVTGYEMWGVAVNWEAIEVGDCYSFWDSDPDFNFEDKFTAWTNHWPYDPRVDVRLFTDRNCESPSTVWTNAINQEVWATPATLSWGSFSTRAHV